MYGEKFIEHKIEGDKIIRVSEFKWFNHNFEDLLEELYDYVTDDWEMLGDKSIYFNRMEEFDQFDVDSVLDWVYELIEEKKEDNVDIPDSEGEWLWLEKWIEPLKEASGFVIHINWKPEWCKK